MRSAGPSAFVAVILMHSFLVSATIPEEVAGIKCKLHPTNLCDTLRIQPDQLTCTTCNLLMLAYKKEFDSTTRADMIEKLLHTCYSLHSLSDTCANIVSNYFDDFYELAKQHLQSNDICQVVSMCANAESTPEALAPPAIKSDQFYCGQCKQLVQHLRESLLHNTTEAQFRQKLDGYCKKTRGFKNECLTVVDQFYHIIYSILKSKLDADSVCSFINVCHEHKKLQEETESLQLIDTNDELESSIEPQLPQCFACKSAFRIVKKLIRSNISNEKLKNAMNQACNKVGKLSNKCHGVIDRHGDQMARFARNPRVICALIGMCFPIGQQDIQLAPVELEVELLVGDANKSEQLQLTADIEDKQSINCQLCKKVFKTLHKMVEHHQDIKLAMDRVCHVLKEQNLMNECQNIIKQHADMIIDLIKKNVPRQQICRALNKCLIYETEDLFDIQEQLDDHYQLEIDDEQHDLFALEEPLTAVELISKGSPKCAVCKTAIKALQHMVQHHEDKGEITKALGHVCHRMGKLQHACESVVNNHGAQIVDLMAKHMSAELICKAIHVCHLSTARDEDSEIAETMLEEQIDQSEALELVQLAEGPVCIFCELFISKFKTSVNSKEKQTHFIKEILTSCDQLPSMFRKECHDIAVRFGPLALDMLGSVSPQEACRLVHFCFSEEEYNAFVALVQAKLESSQLAQPEQGPICIICELLVTRFEKLLDTKAKRAHILHSFLVTCDYMPHFIRNPCHSLIYGYGAAALDLISKVKPEDVCNHLPRCSSQTIQDSNENIAQ
nr:prosaposin isoform X2 [Drosophila virilis]